jgi:hypothetical protein
MNPDSQPQPPQPPRDETPNDPYYGGQLGAGIDWSDPNSPLAPYYTTTGGLVAVGVLGLALFILSILPLWHTDFWVHLKYGEWIVANRSLPDREPLSPFTDKQTRMFDPQWLSQVGYHGVFRAGQSIARGDEAKRFAGGVEAVRLAHLFAAVAALGLLGLAYRRAADSVPWAVGGMVLVLVLMLGTFAVQRPQTLALACFAALLCVVSRATPTRRAPVLVPLVMVLWANIHGSFVAGFGLLAVVLIGRVIEVVRAEGWSGRAVWRDDAARRLTMAFVASAVGVAVLNPYGPVIYLDVIRFVGHPNLRTMAEWQPLDFTQSRGGHWTYLATAVLIVATPLATRRMYTPTQLLLVLAFAVWPVFQQRMMTWWVPLVPWIIAPHWVAAAERWGMAARENVPDFRKTALAVVLAVVAFIASPASTWLKTGKPRPPDTALHPGTPYGLATALKGEPPGESERAKALAAALKELPGGRVTGPIFASESQGEFLLWALPGDMPVMMFNHAQLFDAGYWSECVTVKQAGPRWSEILDRHRATLVIVETDYHPQLRAALLRHPAWRIVLDESRSPGDADSRLFVAVRKPLVAQQ